MRRSSLEIQGSTIQGDAQGLRDSYRIACAGVISLEDMATKRNILARSLADLDAMFGRPGREVIKTKALLGWDWDSTKLDPRWVWYAAKDAFAGLAIYENMLANNIKEGYVPYGELHPMTEREEAADLFDFLVRAMGGNGRVNMRKQLTQKACFLIPYRPIINCFILLFSLPLHPIRITLELPSVSYDPMSYTLFVPIHNWISLEFHVATALYHVSFVKSIVTLMAL